MKKLATAFMLVLGIVLLIMNYQLKQRENNMKLRVEYIKKQKSDFLFDTVIPEINSDAYKLVAELKERILNIFDSYEDKEILKKELLDNLNGRSGHSYAFKKIGESIQGLTLNDVPQIKADNNDPIILMRNPEKDEYVIAIDMSENCAVKKRFRNAKIEAEGDGTKDSIGQFADKLFYQAYNDLEENRNVTFWNYLPVSIDKPWHNYILNMEKTEPVELRKLYESFGYDLSSLETIEILVSDKIHRYTDYFGESKINMGKLTNTDMPVIIISGYNIIDQLERKPILKQQLDEFDNQILLENERYLTYKGQNDIFSLIIILTFLGLFLYTHDYKVKPKKQ